MNLFSFYVSLVAFVNQITIWLTDKGDIVRTYLEDGRSSGVVCYSSNCTVTNATRTVSAITFPLIFSWARNLPHCSPDHLADDKAGSSKANTLFLEHPRVIFWLRTIWSITAKAKASDWSGPSLAPLLSSKVIVPLGQSLWRCSTETVLQQTVRITMSRWIQSLVQSMSL